MSILKGKSVSFNENFLIVELSDGRIIQTPLNWYKEFSNATIATLKNWHFICQNTGIEWEELDLQLSIVSMLSVEQKTA